MLGREEGVVLGGVREGRGGGVREGRGGGVSIIHCNRLLVQTCTYGTGVWKGFVSMEGLSTYQCEPMEGVYLWKHAHL